jgi:PhoH-like ATPase
MGKIILDTNVILDFPNIFVNNKDKTFIISSIVAEELDNQVHSKYNNKELSYKARMARNAIKNADNVEYITRMGSYAMPIGWNTDKNDNLLLQISKDLQSVDKECVLYTNDLLMQMKAESIGLVWSEYVGECSNEEYKGYRTVEMNTIEINDLYSDLDNNINKLGLSTNEYVEIINKDLKNNDSCYRTEVRFDGDKLVPLKLPPSKIVKGWNVQQRFALDLLNNKDIPIKIINGKHGSGKTMLAVKMGVHLLDKGNYGSLTFWRTPIPADGIEIGFLPGSKQEKIESYMKSMLQYVEKEGTPFYLDNLLREEKINMDVVSFLKGLNVEDSFVIFDECEDLSVKLIKLAGTRIAKNSCIVFTGDYKQAEDRFKNDNGIATFIDKAKGNPLVGIVILDDDVRSEASKVFADLLD